MKKIFMMAAITLLLSGCGGGGSGGSPAAVPQQQVGSAATISGKVTFDQVPVAITRGISKLDYNNSIRRPARSISVALIDSSTGAELATAKTDAAGDYALPKPAAGQSVFVRAYAKLLPVNANTTEIVSIMDNTNGNAQWAIDSAAFSTAGDDVLTKNLHASSGWTGTAYNSSLRVAGTFAILDTIYTGMQKIVAVDNSASFKKLSVYWSPDNVATAGQLAVGQIGSSFFQETTTGGMVSARAIYLLGKANNDTDEYDSHVVAHEFGHYLQSVFSRDDSVGGSHGGTNDRLDMRVAFSEGWGNGWSGYALGDRFYADTSGFNQADGFSFDISAGETSNPGWFKESSVQKVIWDLSTGSIGFGQVWTAMKTGFATSPALTSAHSFANALRVNLPTSRATLDTIFNGQNIFVPSDAYGAGEANFGTPTIAEIQPIYITYGALGSTSNVCVTNAADSGGAGNKAGEHRYLKLSLPAGGRTFTVARDVATTTARIATDPDFRVYSAAGAFLIAESAQPNFESTLPANLATGDYVLVLTDFMFQTSLTARTTCFDVTVN